MKRRLFSLISIILIMCIFTVAFSSCKKNPDGDEKESYEYVPSGGNVGREDESDSVTGENTASGGKYKVDDTWKKNYSVSYTYFDNTSSVTSLKITEKKCGDAIIVEEQNSKSVQYYKANGKDVDCYIIIDGNDTQAHSVLKNTDFSSVDSFFMQKSFVDENMSMEKNVLYMGDETVGGRECCKYILAEYKDSVRVRHIYVWVDITYGFAAKLETYDSDGQLTQKWEISEFSTGNVTEDDVFLDVSAYTFKEAEE